MYNIVVFLYGILTYEITIAQQRTHLQTKSKCVSRHNEILCVPLQPNKSVICMECQNSYLDIHNIQRSNEDVEYHPLQPFLPTGCRVLFLGSFPPQRKRWAKDFCFFYPNYINDHWRIEGQLFFNDKDYFVDTANMTFRLASIVHFLKEKGIGFYDTATAVRRLKDNASDKFLEVIEKTDITSLLKEVPDCRVIVTTGEKATCTICDSLEITEIPKVGQHITVRNDDMPQSELTLYRLPSSSRAYPLSLDKKVSAYREMFIYAGILPQCHQKDGQGRTRVLNETKVDKQST